MRKFTLSAIALAAFALILTTSCSAGNGWVKVKGNKFIDPQGQEIIFRGLCFSDPVKLVRDGQWNERYFAAAADWGANIVRFAVHPINLNAMGWEETFTAMDQGVEWAKQHGMYVIMDWHTIGNLKDERYTSPMYNTTKEETFKFWRTVAQRYKDEPTVALYELYNEPTVTGPGMGSCSWTEWKELQEQIIDTVRTYNPNALCLCAGFNWAYDLTPVAVEPIARENVAYVSHPYPMKRSEPWEEQWEQDFGFVADTYPVICTEIGFCLADEPGAHVPVMSTDVYGEHITKYFEQKGISFTVWCFDVNWSPMLISDWDFTPTTQGRFFKAYLQGQAKCTHNQITMKTEMNYCQSCGMPLNEENLGTNADGSKNEEYCKYCYQDGAFLQAFTMEEMIEHCAQFVDDFNRGREIPLSREEYISEMKTWFPRLKRWKEAITISDSRELSPDMAALKSEITRLASQASIAYASSVDDEGFPWTKAMLVSHVREGIKVFYFSSNTFSLRAAQFKANPKACIYFCDPEVPEGLMLRGTVEVLTDAASKELLWCPGDEKYYPKGVTDPNYCVLKFTALDGRYYSGRDSRSFILE